MVCNALYTKKYTKYPIVSIKYIVNNVPQSFYSLNYILGAVKLQSVKKKKKNLKNYICSSAILLQVILRISSSSSKRTQILQISWKRSRSFIAR